MAIIIKKSAAHSKIISKDDIHARIYNAIVEHRLQPGTKLTEEHIAELFSVSRTHIRGVLQRLAVEQLVTLVPNRGAFVSKPGAEEARDVLEVRRTLEPSAVARLIERIASGKASGQARSQIEQLRALVLREKQAYAGGDRPTAVRLSGEFHVLLAELTGSRILHRMMRELTPLTCLAILAFETPTAAACPNDEHNAIIDAIEASDTACATALMMKHLQHIESAMHLNALKKVEVDLADVLLGASLT